MEIFNRRVLNPASRGVRCDSDLVVIHLRGIMEELVRGDYLSRTHLGLDYFDASINRIAAWTIGTRNAIKALLIAMLEPAAQLRAAERASDYTTRLALMEEGKSLPFAAVWDEHCRRQSVPVDGAWIGEVKAYEKSVLAKRG